MSHGDSAVVLTRPHTKSPVTKKSTRTGHETHVSCTTAQHQARREHVSRTCCHVHSTQVCVCVCPGWLLRPSLVPSAVLPGHQDRYAQCPRLPGLGSLRTACSWQLCGSFWCTRARTGVRLRHWLQRSPRRFPLLFHQLCSLLRLCRCRCPLRRQINCRCACCHEWILRCERGSVT